MVQFFNASSTSYLTACKKDAPDFDACCLSSARAGLPSIINGDKEYNIPNFKPLKVEKVDIKTGTLNLLIEDINLWGLDEADIKDFKVDLKNNKVKIDFHCPMIKILGKYQMDGKLNLLALKGNGDVNLTLEEPDFFFSTSYKLIKKGDYDYVQLEDENDISYDIQHLYLNFGNLFNGNELGKTTNEFLNKEWKSIIEDLNPTIKTTIKTIAVSIINGFITKIPYQNLFL
ncbi:circadian clock-controlled protein daywake-like isoform X2 [Diorhabda carinulata]|uniref:circadian clock-controlled protein daywake-like isoform X2 n=1 Tax=Diorhabda carinulata TaxID=1163345 RepID=UPI0025A0966D|nr:circadian clock-controlled protein daywake-like isoform X2 [Diorhabda carinulata]